MLHLTFSMAPNIVFAPNIRRTQNTDTGRKTQTQLISALGHADDATFSLKMAEFTAFVIYWHYRILV